TLTNLGPCDSQNVTLTDVVPQTGLTLVSLTPDPANPDTFTVSGNAASADTVAAGNSDTFVVVLSPPSDQTAGSQCFDTAQVASDTTPDPDPGNDSSTVTCTVETEADLSVTKVGPATVTAGAQATYTITLANLGPSDSQNVTLT